MQIIILHQENYILNLNNYTMGTNYYRIPSEEEMLEKKELLIKRVNDLNVNDYYSINNQFRIIGKMDMYVWDRKNLWDEFTENMNVHLGKRSSGWKFLWNFHNNEYYSNKKELFQFIRRGRVIDEYSEEIPVEEFIQMALEWGKEDGYDTMTYYEKYPDTSAMKYFSDKEKYYDKYIDGLRVSSSTDFC